MRIRITRKRRAAVQAMSATEALREQRAAFRRRFGREPGLGEPLYYVPEQSDCDLACETMGASAEPSATVFADTSSERRPSVEYALIAALRDLMEVESFGAGECMRGRRGAGHGGLVN